MVHEGHCYPGLIKIQQSNLKITLIFIEALIINFSISGTCIFTIAVKAL